jgi:hypothetical protein
VCPVRHANPAPGPCSCSSGPSPGSNVTSPPAAPTRPPDQADKPDFLNRVILRHFLQPDLLARSPRRPGPRTLPEACCPRPSLGRKWLTPTRETPRVTGAGRRAACRVRSP